MANDSIKPLAQALHDARTEDRVSMRQLARVLGCSFMTLYRIESGCDVKASTLLPLLAALNEPVRLGGFIVYAWEEEPDGSDPTD